MLLISGAAFATDVPYHQTQVAKVLSCTSDSAEGLAACKKLYPEISTDPYVYDTDHQVFFDIDPQGANVQPTIKFENGVANVTFCGAQQYIAPAPVSYCQNPANHNYQYGKYVLSYDSTSGVITEGGDVLYDFIGKTGNDVRVSLVLAGGLFAPTN